MEFTHSIRSGIADVRGEPGHRAEMTSQLVHGDPVNVVETTDEWSLTVGPDGYRGWVRNWHLTSIDPSYQATHYVAVPLARLRRDASQADVTAAFLPTGSRVVTTGATQEDWAQVRLVDGALAWLPAAQLSPVERAKANPAAILRWAQRFSGAPYLWGGTTAAGIDCSGLVQRVFGLCGVSLPRDSADQAARGIAVDGLERLSPGDLVFFGGGEPITHVGIVAVDRTFIHAHGQVRETSLDPKSQLFEPHFLAIFRLARRVLV